MDLIRGPIKNGEENADELNVPQEQVVLLLAEQRPLDEQRENSEVHHVDQFRPYPGIDFGKDILRDRRTDKDNGHPQNQGENVFRGILFHRSSR